MISCVLWHIFSKLSIYIFKVHFKHVLKFLSKVNTFFKLFVHITSFFSIRKLLFSIVFFYSLKKYQMGYLRFPFFYDFVCYNNFYTYLFLKTVFINLQLGNFLYWCLKCIFEYTWNCKICVKKYLEYVEIVSETQYQLWKLLRRKFKWSIQKCFMNELNLIFF